MYVDIDTCLTEARIGENLLITGFVTLEAFEDAAPLGRRQFSFAFATEMLDEMEYPHQSLDVRTQDGIVIQYDGLFGEYELLDLESEPLFRFNLFLGILTKYLEEKQDVSLRLQEQALLPPEDAYLLRLWRGPLRS